MFETKQDGGRLSRFRLAKGFSVSDFARTLGMKDDIRLRQIETGQHDLRLDTEVLRSLERAWGKPACAYILGDESALDDATMAAIQALDRARGAGSD